MGFGEYPAMFFNVDTPVRLTHAYELLNAKTYPPEMLSLKGFSMFYHYGGPAAVAALSAVTQLAVHKSMFHVVLPILIIGSFSAIHLLCRSVFRKRIYRYVSISLFLPFVYLGTELFVRVFSDHDGGGLTETLMSIGREFIWLEDYHQEKFSKGILDVSQTAGVFLLILASSLLVKRQNIFCLDLCTSASSVGSIFETCDCPGDLFSVGCPGFHNIQIPPAGQVFLDMSLFRAA